MSALRAYSAGLKACGYIFTAAVLANVAGLAQTPPPQTPPAVQPGAQRGAAPPAQPGQPAPGRGGRGGGRGGVLQMTLTSAWESGGRIPVKYTQVGDEVSPPLSWTNVPERPTTPGAENLPDPATSFVLIVHDPNAAIGGGLDDVLHWMVWNIPGKMRSLAEGIPQGPLADGMRQISASGPYYRGPGALAAGPLHHYVFELYALDTMLDVQAVGASPPETRAAVLAAMATHVRGKAVLVGTFKR